MLADHISTWGASYGVKSQTVDGNDVDAVTAAAKDAVAFVRGTRKPFLLETYTYRLRGHMEPDPASYVDPAELRSWKERDPIATYEQRLLDEHAITPAELDAMKSRVRARIEDAAQFAMESPYPSFEELTTNVYA
jgi:pyruvate dehydrogenase E1 component alpha subunit